MNSKLKKILAGVVFIAIAVGLFLSPLREWLTAENLQNFVGQFGAAAPVVYALLYFVLIMFLLPATVFTVVAGVLFGKFWGTVIVVIAATAAAGVAFIIGRKVGGNVVEKYAKGSVQKWVKKIEDKVGDNGIQAFFIMRCLFVPYMLFSYAAGLVKTANLKDFVLGTLFANMIFSFMFVYLGDSLLKGPRALILPVILIILGLQAPKILKKFGGAKYAD